MFYLRDSKTGTSLTEKWIYTDRKARVFPKKLRSISLKFFCYGSLIGYYSNPVAPGLRNIYIFTTLPEIRQEE